MPELVQSRLVVSSRGGELFPMRQDNHVPPHVVEHTVLSGMLYRNPTILEELLDPFILLPLMPGLW